MQKFTIATYNIHKGFGPANVKFNLFEMRKALEELNLDFVFLQEVIGQNQKKEKSISIWPVENQTKFLATNAWQYFSYGRNAIYKYGDHGNAILSKLPFIKTETIVLSKLSRISRGLLHCEIQLSKTNEILHLICAHIGLSKNRRNAHISQLSDRINSCVSEKEPLVIAGDFNDWRNEDTIILEKELALSEVYKSTYGFYAKTYPAIKPIFPNDRIFYRKLTLESVTCPTNPPWRYLSDHLPVIANFCI